MDFPLKTRAGQAVAYVATLALITYWVVAAGPRNFGVAIPDEVHTYGIRFRTGADFFFRPAIGWYIEHGLWVALPLMATAFLIEPVARRFSFGDSGAEEVEIGD